MDFKRLGIGLGLIIVVVALVLLFRGNVFAPACFAENGSKVYIGLSASECASIRFECTPGGEYFSDECGCGCQPASGSSDSGNLAGKLKPVYCTPQSRNAEACTMEYNPVCGWYDPEIVQCITSPCAITVSNSCSACMDSNILYYTQGECPSPGSEIRE